MTFTSGMVLTAIVAAMAVPAMAQAPQTLSALAECRLSHPQAQALLRPLKPRSTKDQSGDGSDIRSSYDPAPARPFGLQATSFVRAEYDDGYRPEDTFTVGLKASYDQAKPAFLRSKGITECSYREGSTGNRICWTRPRADPADARRSIDFRLLERADGVFLRCSYD